MCRRWVYRMQAGVARQGTVLREIVAATLGLNETMIKRLSVSFRGVRLTSLWSDGLSWLWGVSKGVDSKLRVTWMSKLG